MSRRNLIIVGAGGFGRELHAMLWDAFSPDEYCFKGFLAQEPNDLAAAVGPWLSTVQEYRPTADDRFLLAVGEMQARSRLTASITQKGGQFASFIHPRALVASTAEIGKGAVVYPFATVSNQAKLRDFVHLNYYASVGHDATVGQCCLLAPYATLNGMVTLNDFVYMSTHATVVVAKTVGERSKVSANSTVQHDVPADSLVFGVPGQITPIRRGIG